MSPFGRVTHYERCLSWNGGECTCSQLLAESKTCDCCSWSKARNKDETPVLISACSDHLKRTQTRYIPLSHPFFKEHEEEYAEVMRERYRQKRQREERELLRRLRRPFEGRRFDADLRRSR